MPIRNKVITAMLAATLLLPGGDTAHAAIPCGDVPFLPHTASAPPDWADAREPISLEEALQGDGPIDRSGADPITGSQADAVIASAENILRCLDYGETEVLITHSISGFRERNLGVISDLPEGELLAHVPEGVYTERVENVLELNDGNYVVGFRFSSEGIVYTGEFVFQEYDGELYLADSHLESVQELSGKTHVIVITDADAPETITAHNGDVISISLDTEDAGTILIESDDTGEIAFRGNAMVSGYTGGAPKDTWLIIEVEPGNYTATIQLEESERTIEISIEIEP